MVSFRSALLWPEDKNRHHEREKCFDFHLKKALFHPRRKGQGWQAVGCDACEVGLKLQHDVALCTTATSIRADRIKKTTHSSSAVNN